jgi:hypothetical protein
VAVLEHPPKPFVTVDHLIGRRFRRLLDQPVVDTWCDPEVSGLRSPSILWLALVVVLHIKGELVKGSRRPPASATQPTTPDPRHVGRRGALSRCALPSNRPVCTSRRCGLTPPDLPSSITQSLKHPPRRTGLGRAISGANSPQHSPIPRARRPLPALVQASRLRALGGRLASADVSMRTSYRFALRRTRRPLRSAQRGSSFPAFPPAFRLILVTG